MGSVFEKNEGMRRINEIGREIKRRSHRISILHSRNRDMETAEREEQELRELVNGYVASISDRWIDMERNGERQQAKPEQTWREDMYEKENSQFPEISLDVGEMDKCIDFAKKYDYSKALDRGNMGYSEKFEHVMRGDMTEFGGEKGICEILEKVKKDNIAGKIGELIAMHTMEKLGINITSQPDFSIYENGQKSFAPDLTVNDDYGISVKTCRFYSHRYPVSWTLQYNDMDGEFTGRDSHFFGDDDTVRDNEWFCGVLLKGKWYDGCGRVIAMVPMQVLHDNGGIVYERPVNAEKRGTKRVIYMSTLKSNGFIGYNDNFINEVATDNGQEQ